METRAREVKSRQQPLVSITVTSGHFATRNSHINYYIDLTAVKNRHTVSRLAGQVLASAYDIMTQIDTIICLEGTEVLAAFMAESLCDGNISSVNNNSSIAILTPEVNTSGQLMFRDNHQKMIWNKNVLLLVALATTGTTITQALECIDYYSGRTTGISAIFSAIDSVNGILINSIFTEEDVPGYSAFRPPECPNCRARRKIDALVNSYGYSRI